MTARRTRSAADRGSASIWLLACSAVVLLVGVVVELRGAATLARHRVETAADLAALAAAGQIGVAGDGCDLAAAVARANGATLVTCRAELAADGRSGIVDVRVRLTVRLPVTGARTAVASARAGRLAATPSGMPTTIRDLGHPGSANSQLHSAASRAVSSQRPSAGALEPRAQPTSTGRSRRRSMHWRS